MEWNLIFEGLENGVFDGYNVEYWVKGNNWIVVCEISNDEYIVFLDGFLYNMVYMIWVVVFMRSGLGEFLELIFVEMKMCK